MITSRQLFFLAVVVDREYFFLCVQTWEHYLDMISLDQIILDQYRSVGEIDRPLVSDLFL